MIIKALLWKEFKSLTKNIKSKVVMAIGTIIFIYLLLFIRLHTSDFSISVYRYNINYMTVILGYLMFISNLRFWYEKNMNMLETLFIMPTKLYVIIIGKMILPILISVSLSVIFYFLSTGIGWIVFKSSIFSFITLFEILLISVVFQIFYSIINCYAMWCASLAYAKVIQFISVMLYMGSVFTMFVIPTNFSLYNSLGTWIVMAIIGVYAAICYSRINKEKAMNTLSI
ncbi:hypothetical protein DES36_107101 [Alkalibaculum bacchi]|uniref:ABC-2 family transporter n=1 Tax=Alkalibaculum bacchi TaxID=645887 RepID=A0A366I8B3_9FIRM|nr:hypothetical protein [Alkalibaculum bacchi]RBP65361.1 hypothetical protein DES36_107101 [Alkalibaculum bacchi]